MDHINSCLYTENGLVHDCILPVKVACNNMGQVDGTVDETDGMIKWDNYIGQMGH